MHTANELRDRGALGEEECFIDATFTPIKAAFRDSHHIRRTRKEGSYEYTGWL